MVTLHSFSLASALSVHCKYIKVETEFARINTRYMCVFQAEFDELYNSDFFPNKWLRAGMLETLCRDGVPTQRICSSILFFLGGMNSTQLNTVSRPYGKYIKWIPQTLLIIFRVTTT
jgi:hypothetical protein